jgi:hypothetical protein
VGPDDEFDENAPPKPAWLRRHKPKKRAHPADPPGVGTPPEEK